MHVSQNDVQNNSFYTQSFQGYGNVSEVTNQVNDRISQISDGQDKQKVITSALKEMNKAYMGKSEHGTTGGR